MKLYCLWFGALLRLFVISTYIVIIKLFMAIDSLVPRLLPCRKPPFSAGEEPGYEVVSEPDPPFQFFEGLVPRLGTRLVIEMLDVVCVTRTRSGHFG